MIGRAFLVAACAALLAGCAPVARDAGVLSQQRPEPALATVPKPGWLASRFMVVAAHPLAVEAGYRVLRAGGSAVDAAIAAQLVLGLVEPQSSGIGGGLFLVHFDGRAVQAFDGRETAPAAATPSLFLRDGRPMAFGEAVVGGRSVGVPGALRALELAHRAHGRLAWASLFEPAIRFAEDGFAISLRLHASLAAGAARALRDDPGVAAHFLLADGSPKPVGTRLRNPAYAAVLREIAERGADAFYQGPIARAIVAKVRGHARNPGLMTEADLAGYRAIAREPLCFDYRRWTLCGMPPPTAGTLALAQMLSLLAPRDMAALAPVATAAGPEPDARAVHLISEAGRLAYADRDRFVADPAFEPLPGGSAAALLDPAYLAQRRALIGERSMGVARPGTPLVAATSRADGGAAEFASTSHVSIVDGEGHAVALTTSIENLFGAQLMVHGFMLNNQLTDFSFVPSRDGVPVANRVQGGKRPRSAMAPLLVFERRADPARGEACPAPCARSQPGDAAELALVIGSPGGPAIVNNVAKVLFATLDWTLDVQQAIALPNFGSRNGPTELEAGRVSQALVDALAARGHAIEIGPQTSGLHGIQRVVRDGRPMWLGGADPRREGVALGD